MCGPMQGACVGAILLEGWAADEEAALELARGGGVTFEPCHVHAAVGPMAGMPSPPPLRSDSKPLAAPHAPSPRPDL